MKAEQSATVSQAKLSSGNATRGSAQPSNGASRFSSTVMAAAASTTEHGAALASAFLPGQQPFQPCVSSGQPPFAFNPAGASPPDHEPGASSSAPLVTHAVIQGLPGDTTEDAVKFMVLWSNECSGVELLPPEPSRDGAFRSAIVSFKTFRGAVAAKEMFDGRANTANSANMTVKVLPSAGPGPSPHLARRYMAEPASQIRASGMASSAVSCAAASARAAHQPLRFNGGFPSAEHVSPTSHAVFPAHELSNGDAGQNFQRIFSPMSPIGSHLSEQPRISGKSLINDNCDDDETSDLLKDPRAYAENGAGSQRRATAPQIPIGRMASLSLITNHSSAGPSSLPPYISPTPTQPNVVSPISLPGPGINFSPGPSPYYARHTFPPVNPADQNPPCNTLYVGNLPIDTSEEELKAVFSKQRGYKRLCYRTKGNGPMCFVEFEDISFATKALHDLYGHPLHNSVKGGIRLSFSKNPLGVRSGQTSGPPSSGTIGTVNGMMHGVMNGFTTANGPPPGLAAPPGLSTGHANYNVAATNNGNGSTYHGASFPGIPNSPWNNPAYKEATNPGLNNSSAFVPSRMLGR